MVLPTGSGTSAGSMGLERSANIEALILTAREVEAQDRHEKLTKTLARPGMQKLLGYQPRLE